MVVTGPERLENPLFLPVCELVEHRAEIGHLIVVLKSTPAVDVIKFWLALLAVRACHGRLTVQIGRRLVRRVLPRPIHCSRVPNGHLDARHLDGCGSVELPGRLTVFLDSGGH